MLLIHLPKVALLGLAFFSQVDAEALRYNISLNSQVRSAYAGPHAITVSWNTYFKLTPAIVHYGESKNALLKQASSNISITYPTSLTYNNHVRIEGLQSDTKYWYLPEHLINSTETVGPFTFRTPRLIGDETPYSVALIVDMGAMGPEGLSTTAGTGVDPRNLLLPGEQNTIQSLAKAVNTYDFVMQPGDFAYADTWLTEVNQGYLNATTDLEGGAKAYESILETFYDQCTSFTQYVPFMTAPGNHEANCIDAAHNCPVGQTNFTGYVNHWKMPSDVANQAPNNFGVGNMWYSYDNGMVHYIMLDMETDMPGYAEASFNPIQFGSYLYQQRDFLAADLAAVDRCKTPWIVVTGHRQWYSSSSGGQCTACQDIFEELFNKYQVDIYLSGHYHVYERQHPIGLNGTIDPRGLNDPTSPWYIINGIGGHYGGLNPFNVANSPYQAYGLSILNATYGWSKLTFHNRTHLTHAFVNSSSDAVLDKATLFKNHNFGKGCKPVVLPSSTVSSATSSRTTSTSPSGRATSSSTTSGRATSSSTTSGRVTSSSTTSGRVVPTSSLVSGPTISTVLTTRTSTITACAATVTNCPARIGSVTIETITLFITSRPNAVSLPTASVSPNSPKPSSSAPASKGTGAVVASSSARSSVSSLTGTTSSANRVTTTAAVSRTSSSASSSLAATSKLNTTAVVSRASSASPSLAATGRVNTTAPVSRASSSTSGLAAPTNLRTSEAIAVAPSLAGLAVLVGALYLL